LIGENHPLQNQRQRLEMIMGNDDLFSNPEGVSLPQKNHFIPSGFFSNL